MSNKNSDRQAIKNANKTTDELISLLSTTLVELNNKTEILRHYYEKLDWETEVCYTLEDGIGKLGVALALLELDSRDTALIELDKRDTENTDKAK